MDLVTVLFMVLVGLAVVRRLVYRSGTECTVRSSPDPRRGPRATLPCILDDEEEQGRHDDETTIFPSGSHCEDWLTGWTYSCRPRTAFDDLDRDPMTDPSCADMPGNIFYWDLLYDCSDSYDDWLDSFDRWWDPLEPFLDGWAGPLDSHDHDWHETLVGDAMGSAFDDEWEW